MEGPEPPRGPLTSRLPRGRRVDDSLEERGAPGRELEPGPAASALLELEERRVRRAVVQRDYELTAGPRPRVIGLPDVVVLVGGVAGATAAGVDRILYVGERGRGVARDLARRRAIRGEDTQPLVAAQAELHRDPLARLDDVQRGRVVDGLEEARTDAEDRQRAHVP